MHVEINYWGVLLAAVSSMVVGSLWYMPAMFGKAWMNLAKVKPDRANMTAAAMAWMYGSVFVASFVTAYMLAYFGFTTHYLFNDSFLRDYLTTALGLWLGFTAARIYVHDVFEMRRKKLTLLNVAHELVTVVVMALLISWLHP